MSDEMKNKKNEDGELTFGESHVMCNLFSLKALKKLAKKYLPYHIAYKKSEYMNEKGEIIKPENPNVYKFETFIFDSWIYFKDIAVLRGKRPRRNCRRSGRRNGTSSNKKHHVDLQSAGEPARDA